MKAWKAAGVEPITLHEARHCAVSFFIASGLNLKQVSRWAGHSDIRTTLNRKRHAADRLTAYLAGLTVAHPADSADSPAVAGLDEYRYRDSNPSGDP
jgi:site-specific recombinase XerD